MPKAKKGKKEIPKKPKSRLAKKSVKSKKQAAVIAKPAKQVLKSNKKEVKKSAKSEKASKLKVSKVPNAAKATSAPSENAVKLNENGKYKNNQLFDPTYMYLKEIGFSPLLSAEEEVKYGRLALKGDLKARHKMIVSNLRLVVKIARRYYNRGMEFSDLIEEGNLGLLRAVEKFDPERGFRFSTYATWWIRQTIERAIMNQTRTIRLPIHVLRELNMYLSTARELVKTQDHEPTHGEIAQALDKSIDDVKNMLELNERMISLDVQVATENSTGRPLSDALADKNAHDPEESLATQRLHQALEECLNELNEKQREVICRRFGLAGYDRQTLEQVGEAVGLTRERVRQIQMSGLKVLREILTKRGLDGSLL